MADTRRRALIAALVAALGASLGIAGVGHAYLREWRRAVAWFSLVLGAALILWSLFADPETVQFVELPLTVTVPILALLLLSTFDAYRIAHQQARPAPDALDEDAWSCPYCGKSIDPELDFCHWCTQPLPHAEEFEPPNDSGPDTGTERRDNEI